MKEILSKFKGKKVLVLGDIMLDKYTWGVVRRMSPEAPVQIVNVEKESFVPGGAANAANNIAALSGIPYLVGIIGNDHTKDILMPLLRTKCINIDSIIENTNIPTIVKNRIMVENRQVLRIDHEKQIMLSEKEEKRIINNILNIIKNIDIILISDYAKGTVTKNIMNSLIENSKKFNKKIIIDPKPKNKNLYRNCYLMTPNTKEAIELSGINGKITEIGNKLVKMFNCNILITRSEDGMSLFEKNKVKIIQFDVGTKAKKVIDVSGAGDTMAAALTMAIASGANLKEASIISNYAAGITIGKVGTSTVSVKEIEEAMKNDK